MDYYICPKGCGRVDNGRLRLINFRLIIVKDIERGLYKIDKEVLDTKEWKASSGLPLKLL